MDGFLSTALIAAGASGIAAAVCRSVDRVRPSPGLPEAFLAAVAMAMAHVALVMDLAPLWAALGAGAAVLLGIPAWQAGREGERLPMLSALVVALLAGASFQAGGAFAVAAAVPWAVPAAAAGRLTGRVPGVLLGFSCVAAAAGTAWMAVADGALPAVALAALGMVLAVLAWPLATAVAFGLELDGHDSEASRSARSAEIAARLSAGEKLGPDQLLELGLDTLVEWSGADLAGIALIREDASTVELVAHRNVPEAIREELRRDPLPTETGVLGRVLVEGRPMLVDPAEDPHPTRSFPAEDGWRSVMLAPLARGGSLGVVGLVSRTAGSFDEEHLRTLGEVAEALGPLLDEAHAQLRLDRERRFSRQLLERAGVLVVAMDRALRITLFNRTATSALGRSAADALGKDGPVVLVAEPDRESFRQHCLAQFSGEPASSECEVRAAARCRAPRWHLWRFAVVPGDGARPAELVTFGIDVTEKRRSLDALEAITEEALRVRRRAERAVSELQETRERIRRAEGPGAGAWQADTGPEHRPSPPHEPPPAEARDTPGLALEPSPADRQPPSWGDALRVLAVDDEDYVLEIVGESLRRQGFAVDTATDGEDALHLLTEGQYDLILSDLQMPGMTGPQLYAVLLERWPHLARRTLFLTGDTVSESSRAFFEETGVPYLEKPFDLDELLQAVREATGRVDTGGEVVSGSGRRGP